MLKMTKKSTFSKCSEFFYIIILEYNQLKNDVYNSSKPILLSVFIYLKSILKS